LPALIIGLFLLYLGNAFSFAGDARLCYCTLVLAIALPWCPSDSSEWLGYINFLVSQPGTLYQHRQSPWGPWYYHFPVVLLGLLLVNLLAVAIARLQFWQRAHYAHVPPNSVYLPSGLWVFLVFTIAATKLPSYVLPLMPAAAIRWRCARN